MTDEEIRVLQERLKYYLRQLAPHQKEREAAQLLVALQFALTSQAEQIKGLEAAARFWQDKAGDMAEQVRKLEAELDQAFSMLEMNGVPKERARHIANGIDVLTTRYRKRTTELEQQLAEANEKILMKFSEERVPEFSQGFKSHELLEPVTAEDCQHYVATEEIAQEALALTPDLSALDAYFKRSLDEVMTAAFPKEKP